MVRSQILQKRFASALLLTTIAVQLQVSGVWSILQNTPAFRPFLAIDSASAQVTFNGSFVTEGATPKYDKTWLATVTCRSGNSTQTYGTEPFGLSTMVANAAAQRGVVGPTKPIVRTDGGSWDVDGTPDLNTLNTVCKLLQNDSSTYVSSTCRDSERSSTYPNGKCNFHTPQNNQLSRFSGTVGTATEQCRDGIDNDGDGSIDLNDFSCSSSTDNDETNPKAQCQDGIDNDGDGVIDALITSSNSGGNTNLPATFSLAGFAQIRDYLNAHDNAGISANFSDQGAASNDAATRQRLCQVAGYSTVQSSSCTQPGETRCNFSSQGDNYLGSWNGNGYTIRGASGGQWLAQITCSNPTNSTPTAQCQDGIDNDGDGQKDFPNDAGCASATDISEVAHDPGCTDQQDNDEYNAPPTVDLSISKSGPATVVRGQTLVYTIQLLNNSQRQATNVIVTDQIPSGLTYNDAQSYAPCTQQGNNVVCNVGSLNANQTGTFQIAFDVPTINNCSSSTNVSNTASVSADQQDSNSNNNTATQQPGQTRIDCPTVQCNDGIDNDQDGLIDFPQDPGCTSPTDTDEFNAPLTADLSISKTGPASVVRGQSTFFYSINISNAGPAVATNVVVTDVIPSGLNYNDAQSYSGCNQQGGSVVCTYPSISVGQQVSYTIAFDAPLISNCSNSLNVTNTATVRADQSDASQSNNTSQTVTTRVDCPVQPQCNDGIDNDNDGATDLQDFSCSGPTDNDETNPKAACQDGVDNDSDGKVDFPQDPGCSSLQDNDEFNAPTPQCQDGVDNDSDGLVDFPNDPGCANPTDNDEFNAPLTVDLSISKAGPASVVRGQTILYTITVGNSSQRQATNVIVTDPIPSGLTYNDGQSFGPCSQQGSNVVCTIATLDANQFGSFTIAFNAPLISNCSAPVNIINTASIRADQTDSNSTNNNATQPSPTRVDCPVLPQCNDGVDNDNDGATDYPNDFSCTSPTDNDETNPKAACQDGVDNDQDGLVDFPQDPGCSSLQDNDESNAPTTTDLSIQKTGPASVTRGTQITYTITVTNSGLIPAQNVVISDTLPNGLSATNFVAAQSVGCVLNAQETAVLCNNFSLNAGQMRQFQIVFNVPTINNCSTTTFSNIATVSSSTTDTNSSNNTSSAIATTVNCQTNPQCSDGIDNDFDGATDLQDFSCSGPTDNDETNPKAACQDGIDNDNDNLTDFPFDPGCTSFQDNDEFNAPTTVDVSIQKTGPASVVRGQTIFYTIQVGNAGSIQATNVVVTDAVPAGLTYNDGMSYGPCALQGSNVVCTIGTLLANQFGSFQIAFDAPVISNCTAPVNISNTASITATQQDSNSSNNTSTQPTPTRVDCPVQLQCNDGVDNDFDGLVDFPQDPGCTSLQDNDEFNAPTTADLTITKTGPSSVTRGNQIVYTVTAQNLGQSTAQNVVITDTIPAGLTAADFVAGQSVGCVLNSQQTAVLCNNFALNANQSRTFQITFNVPTLQGCTSPATFSNTASVSSSTTDSNSSNNTSAAVTSTVNCQVNPQCSDGIDNDFDGATDLQDFSCSGPTDNDETNPKAACQDGIDNDNDNLTDFPFDPGCTSFQDNDEFNAPTTVDVSIQKTGPASVVRGQTIFYTIQVGNAGSIQATNVVVTDAVPAGLTYNDGMSYGPCALQGSNVVCTIGTLLVNQFGSFQIAFDAPVISNCTAPVNISNTASITATQQDSNSSNNTSTQPTPTRVDCPTQTPQCADGIDNDLDGATDLQDFSCSGPTDNDETNPKAACQDGVDNDFDGLVDFPQDPGCSSLQDNDEFNAATPQCSDGIDNDFDGATDLQDFSCSGPTDNDETNPKAACQDGIDNDNDNLTDYPFDPGCTSFQDNDEFNAPTTTDLSIAKTGPASVTRGQIIFYTIQVGNAGSIQATNVVVTDAVPAGLTYNDGMSYGPCALQGSNVVCTIGTLLANQFGSFQIAFDAPVISNCTAPVNISNTASITATQQDSNSSNNTSTQPTPTRVDCPVVTPACRDSVDNDFDGLVDFPNDPGCTSQDDTDEFNAPVTQCTDGIDNDGDGRIDTNDAGCGGPTDNNEGDGPADLAITLAGPSTVQGGGTASYVATIVNNGPDAATTPFSIRVSIPTGVTFNAAQSSQNCSQQGVFVACTGITLGLFQQTQRTITFNIPNASIASSLNVTNLIHLALGIQTAQAQSVGICNSTIQVIATVTPTQPDPNQTNNQSQAVSTFVACQAAAQCSDQVDNDNDGRVDYPQDPGCSSPTDNNESDDPVQYGCIVIQKDTFDPHGTLLPITAQFTFTLDATRVAYNDASGYARFDQVLAGQHSVAEIIPSGWTQLSIAPQNGTVTVTPGTNCAQVTFRNRQVFVANAQCSDGYDNDGDGKTDFPQDTGCSSATDNDEYNSTFVPACSDNVDNDGDGLKDFPLDPGCADAADNNESNTNVTTTTTTTTVACNDGIDNDGDGLKDFPQDTGCSSASDTDEFNFRAPYCSDGIDNDGDSLVDYPNDPGCTTPYDDNEYNNRLWVDRWKNIWNWNW